MSSLLSGRRLLIVEDEMLVLMQIEMTLQELGCSEICACANITQALELLASHPFDAAIVDVNLSGEKSYPVADALAQLGIPFVFSTGYSDHGDRADLEDRPVLRKPYTRAALVRVLEWLAPDTPLPVVA
uniref:response regulator n=1 Tax=uncultured Sphingomonas sp. TaxID=158754 RepID=UPI0035CC0A05